MLLPVPIENICKKGIANKPKIYYNFKYNEGQLQLDFHIKFYSILAYASSVWRH